MSKTTFLGEEESYLNHLRVTKDTTVKGHLLEFNRCQSTSAQQKFKARNVP